MNYPTLYSLLDNAFVLPVCMGVLVFRKLDKEGKVFWFYLLLSLITELTKAFTNSVMVIKIMTYTYIAFDTPLLYYVLRSYSNTPTKIHQLYIITISVVAIEVVFFENNHPRVSWSKILNLLATVFLSINAFVFTISRVVDKKILTHRLLIIVPQIFFFLFHLLYSIIILLLYTSSRKQSFIDFFVLLKYIGLLSSVAFTIAFFISPKKEQYLE